MNIIFEFFFKKRLFLVNIISSYFFLILYLYSNLEYYEVIIYVISVFFMNFGCLKKEAYISSQIWWVFIFLGFVLNPCINLLMGIDYFKNGTIWYSIVTISALALCSYVFPIIKSVEYLSHNKKNEKQKINKKMIFIFYFFLIFITLLNFENKIFFRGLDTSFANNNFIIMGFNLLLTLVLPAICCFVFHNINKRNFTFGIIFLLFSFAVLYISIGSRAFIIIMFLIFNEIYRRDYKLNNAIIISSIILFFLSFTIVTNDRNSIYNHKSSNIELLKLNHKEKLLFELEKPIKILVSLQENFLKLDVGKKEIISISLVGFENLTRRWLGQDGLFHSNQYIKKLSTKELLLLKKKVLIEKKVTNEINWYEPLVRDPSISKEGIVNLLSKNNLNASNSPGIIGFLSIFFSVFGVFIVFSFIVSITHFIDYLSSKVFPGHWIFITFISLTIINRFIHFGIYFADSYKLFIGVSLIFLLYGIMFYYNHLIVLIRKVL